MLAKSEVETSILAVILLSDMDRLFSKVYLLLGHVLRHFQSLDSASRCESTIFLLLRMFLAVLSYAQKKSLLLFLFSS